jgi:methanogenic corrinoid protein MtbC1
LKEKNMSEENKQRTLKKLAKAVIVGNKEMVEEITKEVLSSSIDTEEAIINGLAKGMRVVSSKYKAREYFPPNVLLSAEAMHAGLKILLPNIPVSKTEDKGKIILDLIEGQIPHLRRNGAKAKSTECQYCQTVGEVKILVDSIIAAVEMMQKEKGF